MELNLNRTKVQFFEIVGLIDAVKTNKNLEELALKIDDIQMNLKDIKTVLKPLRVISRLSDLKLDVKIRDKNNLNMLKSFSHLANLSQLSVDLNYNTMKYEGAKKLLRPLVRHI